MKIGIEIELHSNGMSSYDICRDSHLSYTEFKPIMLEDGTYSLIGVKMSEEYYPDTIEYNFTPFDVSEENFRVVVNWTQEQIEKYGLKLNAGQPKFVGTHIHIFSKEYFSLSHPIMLQILMNYLVDNFGDLNKQSIERLMLGHQLWTYWSHKNENKWFHALKKYGIRPQYYDHHSGTAKYQPIINSRKSATGKPRSLEIRFIPNELMFNGKALTIMQEIADNSFFDRKRMKATDFLTACGKKLNMRNRAETRDEDGSHTLRSGERVDAPERTNRTYNQWKEAQYSHAQGIRTIIWTLGAYDNSTVAYKNGSPNTMFDNLNLSNRDIIEDFSFLPRTARIWLYNALRGQQSRNAVTIFEAMVETNIQEREERARQTAILTDAPDATIPLPTIDEVAEEMNSSTLSASSLRTAVEMARETNNRAERTNRLITNRWVQSRGSDGE